MFVRVRQAQALCVLLTVLLAAPWDAGAKNFQGGGGGGGKPMGGGPGGGGGGGSSGGSQKNWSDPASIYFPGYDTNGDGRLDKDEWKNRANFERLDTNGNGTIELPELRQLYGDWNKLGPMTNPILPSANAVMDPSVDKDRITFEEISKRDACVVIRTGVMGLIKCESGDEMATEEGLFETGLGPGFPKDAFCHGIDEIFALDYTDKTGKGMHGGIDMPTGFGTPILAAADGTIVGKFDPDRNARGRTVVVRHSPRDTGMPFWTYTEYAHLDALPPQAVGQRVRMGEVLGPTGNSGVTQNAKSDVAKRRPGIHFAVYYSDSSRFAEVGSYIVPEHARWMDSNAFYRLSAPYDSPSMKALPATEKVVPTPVMFLDGAVEPTDTRKIWPYACKRE